MLKRSVNQVEQSSSSEAAAGLFDLLGPLASAARVTSPPGTLLVVSCGLSTRGGLDLRQVGWDADPATVAAQLKDRGLLPQPRRLASLFSGLGDRREATLTALAAAQDPRRLLDGYLPGRRCHRLQRAA